MTPRPGRPATGLRARRARLAALLAATAAFAVPAAAQDPFLPGLRWSRSATITDAWIPKSIAFAGSDELVWTASMGSASNLALLGANEQGTAAPLARSDAVQGALSVLSVAAGSDPSACFVVVQFPHPDATHRRTVVERHDAVQAARAGMLVPQWTRDPGLVVNGAARLACDERGTRVFLAVWNSATGAVRVDALDGVTGALLGTTEFAATTLSELAVSADGSRIAVTAGNVLWIGDAHAASVQTIALTSSTRALSFSRDGALLATGGTGALTVRAEAAGGYSIAFQVLGAPNELASRTELARDGSTLAIGWWNAVTGVDLRLEVVDVATRARLWHVEDHGSPGGLQNLPEVVRVSPDGSRIALGTWGDGSGAAEVRLFDRSSAIPVFEADLPGSVQALALDASGTRIAVGHKNTHANQFATTGALRLFDTGERDLAVVGRSDVGGVLELAAKDPSASEVLFLIGQRAPAPSRPAGTVGEFHLRRARVLVVPVTADAFGRASYVHPIPDEPALHGRVMHVQAAFRVNGVLHFSRTVVDPLIW